jgi:cytochrome c
MVLAAPIAWAAGDPAKGAQVFKKCAACHTIEADAPNKIGPNLHGVLGRRAGSVANFNYSAAMRGSGVTWSEEALMKYLENPKAFVPGNKMPFPGLKSEQDREDVISYLKQMAR